MLTTLMSDEPFYDKTFMRLCDSSRCYGNGNGADFPFFS